MTWQFIIRKLASSLAIVLGVVLLTFALFNLAGGDPAAAALGKSAAPQEVEALRRQLGSDLPLLYGRLCRTEAFDSAPELAGGRVRYRRNFGVDQPVVARLSSGELRRIPPEAEELILPEPLRAEFFRVQESPWNSQFRRALGEICRITPEFPYLEVFDFGRSLSTREPIRQLLWRGLGPSLALMIPIFLGELLLGVALALLAAAWKDTWLDRLLVVASVLGLSVSLLAAIIFAQWFLGYRFDLFPVWGWGGIRFLTLPVLVGIVCGLGGSVRFYRTVFVDELGKEYLRTAAAKGCSRWTLYRRHLLRASLLPIITRASASIPFLFTGSLLLESFFGIPGLGYTGIDALMNSDLQLLKALVIVSALLFVAVNLAVDLLYAWADPRVRLK